MTDHTPDCRGCEHRGDCSERRRQECQNELINQRDADKEDKRLFRGKR